MPAVASPAVASPAVRPLLERALRTPGTVWLDAARADADSGASVGLLFAGPQERLRAEGYGEVAGLLDALDRHVAAGRFVAGFLAYEAGYALEPALFPEPPAPRGPLAWFGVYDAPVEVPPEAAVLAPAEVGPFAVGEAAFGLDPHAYAERIARIKGGIASGDVYQVNLTAPVRFPFDGDPLGLYAALRARQRVPYGALLHADGRHVLSLSPELFFRLDGQTITARPMKGTAPRAPSPDDDDRLAAALAADPKNRAENLMIVDLLRNDLARVSEPGSVRVPALFETERYESVTQMTSTVRATLRPGVTAGGVLRALFPCGSVTGAPKLRAMQLIHELEAGPRGVYCGAIGYAGHGRAAFNVPIRTVVLEGGAGTLGVGSGVVWDSDAASEYAECLLKARFLTGLAP